MIGFSEMLRAPATEAGIRVPRNVERYDHKRYPHFAVFVTMQIGRPMPWPTAHFENAQLIAGIPASKIKKLTLGDILAMGYI